MMRLRLTHKGDMSELSVILAGLAVVLACIITWGLGK